MKLQKSDIANLTKRSLRTSRNYRVLTEFVESNLDCALVTGWTHTCADGCAAALNVSIKTYRLGNVKAITRNNEVFLVKMDIYKKARELDISKI